VSAAVEDLLTAIDLAETSRTADLTAADAGLAPPQVTLTLDQPRGEVAIGLGRRDASGKGVFSRVGAAPEIRVAPVRLAELADREASAFRDRRLVPLAAASITELGWRQSASAPQHRIYRSDGRWEDDGQQRMAPERITEALRRLLDLRVTRFVPQRPSAQVPGLIAAGGPGKSLALLIGGDACAPSDGALIERRGPEGVDDVCVAPDALAALWPALDAAAVPDTRLVAAAPDTIARVELTEDGRRVALARTPGGAWRFEAPRVAYAADSQVVDAWLSSLRDAPARRAPAKAAHGVRHLTIEGRAQESVDVAPGDPGYALVAPDPLRFRDRAVLDFAHFDARGLRRTAAGESVELASPDGDAWRAVAPAGAEVDRTNAARVIGALGNLHADAYLAKPPAGTPDLILDVDLQPPGAPVAARHTIELYKKKEAPGCTGRLDRDVAFALPEAACDELRLDLEN
jgi:hypothetical protein